MANILKQSDEISTRPYGGGVAKLHCPNCGFAGLHHLSVQVFDRAEDEATVVHTNVSRGKAAVDPAHSGLGNPSSRRDGVVILFECEGCRADPIALTIAQHKGSTEIGWRYGKPE